MPCRIVNRRKSTRRKYFTQFNLYAFKPQPEEKQIPYEIPTNRQNGNGSPRWMSGRKRKEKKRKKKRSANCRVSWIGTANTEYETWTCDHEWRNATSAFGKWAASHTHQILLRAPHYSYLKRWFFSSTRPVHILFHLTQVFGQKYTSWSSTLPNYLHSVDEHHRSLIFLQCVRRLHCVNVHPLKDHV